MRILYDYQAFNQRFGGISRYYSEIIKVLRNSNTIDISCLFSENIYLKSTLGKKVSSLSRYDFRGKSFLNKEYTKHLLRTNHYDIFHATGDTEFYYKDIKTPPCVLTFHDLIAEYYYQEIPAWREWLSIRKDVLRRADRITCVSKFTRDTMLEYYPFIDPAKTDVIYHGITPFKGDYCDNLYGKYILYVGSRAVYKNFKFMVKSLRPLFEKYKEIKLVCTGAPFNEDEMNYISDNKLMNTIINISYVDDIRLASLYHHAIAFVYPSKYEGFGIPILESFVNNCPVCLANATCFPEIADDAVAYFDPDDEESILSAVSRIIEDSEYASELRQKGIERSKFFTWSKAAQDLECSYRRVISG